VAQPHELFAEISRDADFFREVFEPRDPKDIIEFWHRMAGENWFQAHPLRWFVEQSPELAMPVVLYGDEAPIKKRGRRLVRTMLLEPLCGIHVFNTQ
jgi:hypothetical protein